MAGWTNRGKKNVLDIVYRGATPPTNFYIALVTDTPTADTNVMSDLTEIAAGNGYTSGGFELDRNSTDFDSLVEDDTGDQGELKIKDVSWLASGGSIPSSGDGALYAVMIDDNGTVSSREVWHYWSLTSARSVGAGATLTLQDLELDLNES